MAKVVVRTRLNLSKTGSNLANFLQENFPCRKGTRLRIETSRTGGPFTHDEETLLWYWMFVTAADGKKLVAYIPSTDPNNVVLRDESYLDQLKELIEKFESDEEVLIEIVK